MALAQTVGTTPAEHPQVLRAAARVREAIEVLGVDHGVLYIPNALGVYDTGFAWNGLTSVNEAPSGAEPTPVYADNIKYLNLQSVEEFACTIAAITPM